MSSHPGGPLAVDRHTFLVAGGLSFLGVNLAAPWHQCGRARWTEGRPFHNRSGFRQGFASSWDMKPAPLEYRGPFRQSPTAPESVASICRTCGTGVSSRPRAVAGRLWRI